MPLNYKIEDLCRKYKNEDIHSQFVRDIALKIFDNVYLDLRIPFSLRPLLEASALLHDIGYAKNPSNHHFESFEIVIKNGIYGFNKNQCEIIAGAILFHRKDYAKAYLSPFFKNIQKKEQALALGSILRIADGLDHGHIQNTSILSIRKENKSYIVTVTCAGYKGNIQWAQQKADLWEKIFGLSLKIKEEKTERNHIKYYGIVNKNDSPINMARKLLFYHYRIVTEQYNKIFTSENEEALHDARVALRRFRSVLRLFEPFLPSKNCVDINKKISKICLLLSPIRDNDVWREFLFSEQISFLFKNNANYLKLCAQEINKKKDDQKKLRIILSSPMYMSLMRDINNFLRIKLPSLIKNSGTNSTYINQKLCEIYLKILSQKNLKKNYNIKKMHSLRKLFRRARYWFEFAEPVLQQNLLLFSKRFKVLSDILGELHDCDMAVLHISKQPLELSRSILKIIYKKKQRLFDLYKKNLKKIYSNEMLNNVLDIYAQSKNNNIFLYIMRHADANKTKIKKGGSFSLTKKGTQQVYLAGRLIRLLKMYPQIIVTSPAQRCLETAAFLNKDFLFGSKIIIKRILKQNYTSKNAYKFLKKIKNTILLITHKQNILRLFNYLKIKENINLKNIKKGFLCCLCFKNKINAQTGFIYWHFNPKQMKRIIENVKK